MNKNVFQTDITKRTKQEYLNKVRTILGLSIFLTGIASAGGVFFTIRSIISESWQTIGTANFATQTMMYTIVICCFISLIKIAIDERPFSATLVWCLRIIGGIVVAASILIPRLSGYHSSGFELFANGSFVLIDGWYLMFGFIIVIFSSLIKAGFEMQKEMDEIL